MLDITIDRSVGDLISLWLSVGDTNTLPTEADLVAEERFVAHEDRLLTLKRHSGDRLEVISVGKDLAERAKIGPSGVFLDQAFAADALEEFVASYRIALKNKCAVVEDTVVQNGNPRSTRAILPIMGQDGMIDKLYAVCSFPEDSSTQSSGAVEAPARRGAVFYKNGRKVHRRHQRTTPTTTFPSDA